MLNAEIQLAIAVSTFNTEVSNGLLEGCLSRLAELGVRNNHIDMVKVPGAVEIPLAVKLLARSKKYHAIIALGAVIRGETSHYDHVCEQVSQGCQQVMLEFDLPVVFGILTTNNEKQAYARSSKMEDNKGAEAADVAIHMSKLARSLSASKVEDVSTVADSLA